MKPVPPPPAATPESRSRRERAWSVVIANQLALPGIGTILAGRRRGYLQLALSATGFLCFTAFLVFALPRVGGLLRTLADPPEDPDVALAHLAQWLPWMGIAGIGIALWGLAWLWAWSTSVRALHETRAGRDRTSAPAERPAPRP